MKPQPAHGIPSPADRFISHVRRMGQQKGERSLESNIPDPGLQGALRLVCIGNLTSYLLLFKNLPFLLVANHKPFECIWVPHGESLFLLGMDGV